MTWRRVRPPPITYDPQMGGSAWRQASARQRDRGSFRGRDPSVRFPEPDEKLEVISWDDFFETFEDRQLALIYQDKTSDGKQSRFSKFVRRE